MYMKLMSGPNKLHERSLQKVGARARPLGCRMGPAPLGAAWAPRPWVPHGTRSPCLPGLLIPPPESAGRVGLGLH